MANTSLRIGGNKWAVKEDNLLGYNIIQNKYVPIEMDAVRATTATRVNENGLIEVVPRNLLTYSEQFDNASWGKTNTTITSNTEVAPNGTNTADSFIPNTTSAQHYLSKNYGSGIIPTSSSTYSIYAKANGQNWLFLYVASSTPATSAYFNLSTGTVGTNTSGSNATIQDAGNGWFKCSITHNVSGSTVVTETHSSLSGTTLNYTGNGVDGIYIWGAQLEANSVATDYFPTTDRLNIPRIDYSSGTPSLLVEPQRTNLALRSEEFDNVAWTKQNCTITANSINSPNGTTTADSLIASNGTATFKGLYFNELTIAPKTFSFYVKKGNKDWAMLLGYNGTNNCWFNISNGTLGTVGSNFLNANIESVGDGWYRCYATLNSSVTALGNLGIYFSDSDNSTSCTGDGTSVSAYLWGAQLEAGSNATSYIPTTSASVTRNADVISKTNISGLIGQTEGTVFLNINSFQTNVNRYISISDGTSNNYVYLRYIDSSNQIWFRIASNGVVGSVQTYTYTNPQDFIKTVIRYNNNSFDVFLNGVKIITSVGVNTLSGSINQLKFSFPDNTKIFQGNTKNIALYKTALTDQECINLTTI